MDRPTAILGLTAVALTQRCLPAEALQIARDVLADRDQVTEADLDALVPEVVGRASAAVWEGAI